MPIIDEYFKVLPTNYRLATGADFHTQGKLKLGMKYLVFSDLQKVYQCYVVTDRLKGARLTEFLVDDRVFIQNENEE